jgi:hypothetical protein
VLSEALQVIQATAVLAADPKVVRIPGDERNAYIYKNGDLLPVKIPAALRKHTARDLGELCRYLARPKWWEAPVVVWHSAGEVVAILDDDDRRDRLTLPLEKSRAWLWVEQAAERSPKLTPKEFLTLLRTKLAECVEPGELLRWQTALRNVRLSSRSSTTIDNDKGLEKLGREIEQSCAGAEQIPDTLNVVTSIYRNAGVCETAADVSFDVSIDYDAGAFVLTQIGDAVANAIDGAHETIGDFIRANAKLDAVFYGNP